MAGLVNLSAPAFLVSAGQVNFEVLADVNRADAVIAHLFKGVLDRFALGIEDGLFGSDDNFRFHFKPRASAERPDVKEASPPRQSFFCIASVTTAWRRWGRLAEATVPGKNHLRTAWRSVP